jgi:hypothetical protein
MADVLSFPDAHTHPAMRRPLRRHPINRNKLME